MSKSLLGFVLLCGLQVGVLFGAAEPVEVQTIDDIPGFCTNLMQHLFEQPTSADGKTKSMPIYNTNDGKICMYLNWNSILDLDTPVSEEESTLSVNLTMNTESCTYQPFDSKYLSLDFEKCWYKQAWILSRLTNQSYYRENSTELLLILLNAYKEAIEQIKNGWSLSKFHEYNGKTWLEYLKVKNSNSRQANLIESLALKFGFIPNVDIFCEDRQHNGEDDYLIRLYIRGDALFAVRNTFKFNFKY